MSFLTRYLEKYKLPSLADKHKEELENLEKSLDQEVSTRRKGILTTISSKTFESVIGDYATELMDLVERFKAHIGSADLKSASGITGSFRFVISIGTEVYQLVEAISGEIVADDMTDEQKEKAKLDFGKDLVYFVWKTVDPLKKKYRWIPFKGTIEKKLVMWVAGMGLEAAMNLFSGDHEDETVIAEAMTAMSAGKVAIRKALP